MTAALTEGEEEVDDDVSEPKMKRKSKKVGDQECDVGNTEARQKVMEYTGLGPEIGKFNYCQLDCGNEPSSQDDDADDVTSNPQYGNNRRQDTNNHPPRKMSK